MKKTPKFQINDLILKKKSNHVFQIVKVFNIGKRTSKYRLLNLSTSSETAHLESQIERKATIKEAEANKRLPEEKAPTLEKMVITAIGPYKDHWAIVYIDPNSTYSQGGGRLTVVMDDYVGSTFFSHVSQPSFDQFIAQCDSGYLIKKLFPKTVKWIAIEDGEELLQAIWREHKDDIKELRSSGDISKKDLRELYEELKACEFSSISHLHDLLDQKQLKTISTILSDDWWWDSIPSKINQVYEFLESMFKDVIAKFKKLDEVMA